MDIKTVLQTFKQKLLEKNHDLFIHPYFKSDLEKLLKKDIKTNKNKFGTDFLKHLSNIVEFGKDIYHVDHHEILKNMGNDTFGNPYEIYSIHISSIEYNVRLLLSFDDEQNPLLLTIFNEKSDSYVSSYESYKKLAKKRKDDLMKGDETNEKRNDS